MFLYFFCIKNELITFLIIFSSIPFFFLDDVITYVIICFHPTKIVNFSHIWIFSPSFPVIIFPSFFFFHSHKNKKDIFLFYSHTHKIIK